MTWVIQNPTPTRAEASDVATAIYDGADGIMLSAESAAGKYPVESVEMQQRIITSVENDPVSVCASFLVVKDQHAPFFSPFAILDTW